MTSLTLTAVRPSRGLAWLPLVAILAVCAISLATGRGPTPGASAAAVVGVQGAVPADIYLDATNCTAGSLSIGDILPGDPWKTAQDEGGQLCAIDFGTTNNLPGTSLTMLEDPAAPPAGDAMKCASASCGAGAIDDFENTAAEPAANSEAFGAQVVTTAGLANPVWNVSPAVYDVQDAASTACDTTAVGTGTCGFTWGATATGATAPGTYQAQARLVVLAN
jgi:hypothetical protein